VRLHKTPAQVLVRWAIERGTSAIPKSKDPQRIKKNIDVFDWSLPGEDFRALSSLPEQRRVVVDAATVVRPKNPPPYKTLEEFWDREV
jgi:alcohol dehydrogenase (NADP+)